jgi:protein gp37
MSFTEEVLWHTDDLDPVDAGMLSRKCIVGEFEGETKVHIQWGILFGREIGKGARRLLDGCWIRQSRKKQA